MQALRVYCPNIHCGVGRCVKDRQEKPLGSDKSLCFSSSTAEIACLPSMLPTLLGFHGTYEAHVWIQVSDLAFTRQKYCTRSTWLLPWTDPRSIGPTVSETKSWIDSLFDVASARKLSVYHSYMMYRHNNSKRMIFDQRHFNKPNTPILIALKYFSQIWNSWKTRHLKINAKLNDWS